MRAASLAVAACASLSFRSAISARSALLRASRRRMFCSARDLATYDERGEGGPCGCGCTEKGIYSKLIKMRTGVSNAIRTQIPWTPEDIEQLRHLRDVERKSFTEIAKIMGRPSGTLSSKHMCLRTGNKGNRVELNTISIPEETREEWRRRQAISYRNLTAAFCGDPPIGYSALCKRGQQ